MCDLSRIPPLEPLDEDAMAELVHMLNKAAELHGWDRCICDRLRLLLKAWLEAGRNGEIFENANPMLVRQVNQGLKFFSVVGEWADGRIYVQSNYEPAAPEKRERGRFERQICTASAAVWFACVTMSRFSARLGSCARCGRYYFAKTAHANKAYCSRTCTTTASAVRATTRARKAEHARKIARAQAAIEGLPLSRIDGWKRWVAANAPTKFHEDPLTLQWVTRAVNRGELKPPLPPKGTSHS